MRLPDFDVGLWDRDEPRVVFDDQATAQVLGAVVDLLGRGGQCPSDLRQFFRAASLAPAR